MTQRIVPDDWSTQFEIAHGFAPLFTLDEIESWIPWCGVCADFHLLTDEHSDTVDDMLFPKGYSV